MYIQKNTYQNLIRSSPSFLKTASAMQCTTITRTHLFPREFGRNLNPVFSFNPNLQIGFPKLLKKVSLLKVGSVDALSIQLFHLQSARLVSWSACRDPSKANFQLALHFFDRETSDQSASIAVGEVPWIKAPLRPRCPGRRAH